MRPTSYTTQRHQQHHGPPGGPQRPPPLPPPATRHSAGAASTTTSSTSTAATGCTITTEARAPELITIPPPERATLNRATPPPELRHSCTHSPTRAKPTGREDHPRRRSLLLRVPQSDSSEVTISAPYQKQTGRLKRPPVLLCSQTMQDCAASVCKPRRISNNRPGCGKRLRPV